MLVKFQLSEEGDLVEDEVMEEEPEEVLYVEQIPVVDAGEYVYVCEGCGNELTEIPLYNRYYCGYCGLHY